MISDGKNVTQRTVTTIEKNAKYSPSFSNNNVRKT